MVDTIPSVPICGPMLLSCPQCQYEAHSTFELRQHAFSTHIFNRGSESTITDKDSRFECEIFMCSFCGCSSTDLTLLKDHLELSHSSDLHDDSKATIMTQRIILDNLDADDYHCSSESDFECDAQANQSPTSLKLPDKRTPSTPISTKARPDATRTTSMTSNGSVISTTPTTDLSRRSPNAGKIVKQPRIPGQDWSKLIARSDKKFICLLCRSYVYSGRTEVIFHSVTRHLMATDIEYDLCNYGGLTEHVKRQIGRYFVDGMRIRSGVHYKDAKRVEAALFRSIELHLRYQPSIPNPDSIRLYVCSGCNANFTESSVAYAHVNDELRAFLPEFMRARSCPWSLSTREEWVWCVPDMPIQPLPEKSSQDDDSMSNKVDSKSTGSEPASMDIKQEPIKIVPTPKPITVSGADVEIPQTPLIATLPPGLLPVSLFSIHSPAQAVVGKPNPSILSTNLGQTGEHNLIYANSPLGRIFKVNPS